MSERRSERKRDAAGIGLHSLKPKPGATQDRKRIGRGAGSGWGKTSGRGHGGAGSRSGSKRKLGYEGGQNPIHMRMRKLRGPHKKMSMPFEKFRTATQPVNVSDLEARFDAGAEVGLDELRGVGLAKRKDPVKILAKGEITKSLKVTAHHFSATAKEKIEAAGGTVTYLIEPEKPKPVFVKREKPKKEKKDKKSKKETDAPKDAAPPTDPASEDEPKPEAPGSEAEEVEVDGEAVDADSDSES